MKKRPLILISIAIISAVGIYAYREFNRKPASSSGKEAVGKFKADSLAALFEQNDSLATLNLAGKIIEVEGVVGEKSSEGGSVRIHLQGVGMSNIICQLEPKDSGLFTTLPTGATVCLKGQCNTYQKVDLLPGGDVLLSNCVRVDNK